MIILVTMRLMDNATYPERRDAVSHDWGRFFEGYGVLPVLVPNSLSDPGRYVRECGAGGLLLTGGDDLGVEPTERDNTETKLLDEALRLQLPIFGVCRGLQLINQYFGGQLQRDLPDGHVATTHQVTLRAGWDQVAGAKTVEVNSYHGHGVIAGSLAEPLVPFAESEDRVVEGCYHPKLPLVAIQWHPERENPACSLDKSMFEEWFKLCV